MSFGALWLSCRYQIMLNLTYLLSNVGCFANPTSRTLNHLVETKKYYMRNEMLIVFDLEETETSLLRPSAARLADGRKLTQSIDGESISKNITHPTLADICYITDTKFR